MGGICDAYSKQEWFHQYECLFLNDERFTNTIPFHHKEAFQRVYAGFGEGIFFDQSEVK